MYVLCLSFTFMFDVCVQFLGSGGAVEAWIASSETCGLFPIGAVFLREVQPGEIVEITRKGITCNSRILPRPKWSPKPALCIFEYVYFSRRDSSLEGKGSL